MLLTRATSFVLEEGHEASSVSSPLSPPTSPPSSYIPHLPQDLNPCPTASPLAEVIVSDSRNAQLLSITPFQLRQRMARLRRQIQQQWISYRRAIAQGRMPKPPIETVRCLTIARYIYLTVFSNDLFFL